MCDPITLLSAAATVGSVGANYAANQQQQAARDDALAAERIRQKGYDKEASAINNQSRERFGDFQGQQDQKASKLKDYYADVSNKVTAAGPQDAPIGTQAGSVVAQETAAQRDKAKVFTDQQGAALANQNAFGSLFGDVSRLQARDASGVNQIAKFKKGSSSVLPLELEQASKAGGDLKLLGDLLGGAGSIGLKVGLGGGGSSLGSLFGGGGGAAAASAAPDFGVLGFNPAADDWMTAAAKTPYVLAY